MKKTTLLLTLTLLCLLLWGCAADNSSTITFGRYTCADSQDYTAGGGRISGKVEKLEISWLDGMVEIAYHDGDGILLSETAASALTTETELHWQQDGKALYVKYAASGYRTQDGLDKRLTLLLPAGIHLDSVSISTASAQLRADALRADTISLDSASGSMDMTVEAAGTLTLSTASGAVHIAVQQADTIEASTVSGDLLLQLDRTPDKIDASTVSGSLTLRLPADAGFTADLSTVSGAIGGSLPMELQDNGQYSRGDGHCRIRANTVSGNVQLDRLTD